MPARLSAADEANLYWFFSRGMISFERSTMGAILDRCELFSVARQYPVARRLVLDDDGRVIGNESGITAHPTAELRVAGGYEPDSSTLERYAHVSAVLKRVERHSPLGAQVIEALFGDLGERWALLNVTYGRIGAVFHLTPKGGELLQDEAAARVRARAAALAKKKKQLGAALHLTTVQRMENIVSTAKPELGAALARCQVQARELERDALSTWHQARTAAAA